MKDQAERLADGNKKFGVISICIAIEYIMIYLDNIFYLNIID